MAIYKGSRYEYATIDYIQRTPAIPNISDPVVTPIVIYPISSLGTMTFTQHTCIYGERLDQISNKYYKTPKNWWLIVEANPELKDFIHLPVGKVIRIPNA